VDPFSPKCETLPKRERNVTPTVGRKIYDWLKIQRYHDAGNDRNACMERFAFSISSWYKANQEGRFHARLENDQQIYVPWGAVRRYYEAGHTFVECRSKFGFSAHAWRKAVERGELAPRSARLPLERLIAESKSRFSVKRRLLEAGILKNQCEECGLTSWRGKFLSIQLDHRNGVKHDHRIDNLRMLCPNCHSQTATFSARNKKAKG
jgi:hypothetical protein